MVGVCLMVSGHRWGRFGIKSWRLGIVGSRFGRLGSRLVAICTCQVLVAYGQHGVASWFMLEIRWVVTRWQFID